MSAVEKGGQAPWRQHYYGCNTALRHGASPIFREGGYYERPLVSARRGKLYSAFMANTVVRETSLPGLPVRRGKVRDIYDLGDRLLLVSSDRISAFDWVLPTGIPDKGRVLTQIAAFWFDVLRETASPDHHPTDVEKMDLPAGADRGHVGRVARRSAARPTVVPIECVVRGLLWPARAGRNISRAARSAASSSLAGLTESSPPAGADFHAVHQGRPPGHDENIPFRADGGDRGGASWPEELRRRTLRIFARGSEYARQRGHPRSPTRSFEFGQAGRRATVDRRGAHARPVPVSGRPTSTRPAVASRRSTSSSCATGCRRPIGTRTAPRRPLPDDVVAKTRQTYVEAYERLTDRVFG